MKILNTIKQNYSRIKERWKNLPNHHKILFLIPPTVAAGLIAKYFGDQSYQEWEILRTTYDSVDRTPEI